MGFLLWHYLTDSASRFASRPAVRWRNQVLTYAELDDQSNRLATLLARHGACRGTRVAFYMPKTHRSVVAMLGALKAGATYVPIDPGAPPARAAYIMQDCAVVALVTTRPKLAALRDVLSQLPALRFVMLADDDASEDAGSVSVARWSDLDAVAADRISNPAVETDPAYMLYTSGSTGLPKGVILTHRNAMTFVDWASAEFGVRCDDRVSNHAPLHFDLSVFDVYASLRSGACVVLVPEETALFPMELARWIASEQISVWYSVPSALTRLLLHGKLERFGYEHLRTVLYAGEVFPVKYLRGTMERMAHAEFVNLYGPTETNVCTFYRVPRPLPPDVVDIPIGSACANTEVFALTESGLLAGVGEEGELCVRGPSVMPGYWGLPDKSKAVLQTNPLQSSYQETMYRTGDIVRQLPDGGYAFLGRRDHMVKCRGYRIELGEIEQVLYRHGAVTQAVVLAIADEHVGARLRAIVALHQTGAATAVDLRAFCLAHLPNYMVPEHFDIVPQIPSTSTGKADRQALAQAMPRECVEMEGA